MGILDKTLWPVCKNDWKYVVKNPLVANGIHHKRSKPTGKMLQHGIEYIHLPAGEMIGNIEFNKLSPSIGSTL